MRGPGNPFDQMNPKHTAGFMTMRTDGFELELPAGHYHVVVHLRAAEFTAPDRMAVDPRVQLQWPLPGTIEVVKGQVKALNLKVDAYHPDQPAPASAHILSSPLDGPPASHAEPATAPALRALRAHMAPHVAARRADVRAPRR